MTVSRSGVSRAGGTWRERFSGEEEMDAIAPTRPAAVELKRPRLDYVFASRGFHDKVQVHAMNDVGGFGLSNHCQMQIEVE